MINKQKLSRRGKTDWQTGRLADWQTGRLADWQTGRLADWQTGRLADWQTGRLGWAQDIDDPTHGNAPTRNCKHKEILKGANEEGNEGKQLGEINQ